MMLGLRSIARAVPRSAPRFSTVATRSIRSPILSRSQRIIAPLRTSAAFSTSIPRFNGNEELVERLSNEIATEQDHESDRTKQTIQEYLSSSEFQIEDIEGDEEVALTRTYGDEKIRVVFSIASFNSEEMDADEDAALYDEDAQDLPEEGQSGGANTKGSINQGRSKGGNFQVAPEDDIAPADREELRSDEEGHEASFPVAVQVHVTKAGKGAVTISCTAEAGEIEINDVSYFPKTEMAEAKSPEHDYARRSLYTGPPFSQLDEEIQILLERYLEDRGVDTAMALFIPDYIDVKEQKEYVRWLGKIRDFVE